MIWVESQCDKQNKLKLCSSTPMTTITSEVGIG